MRSRKVSAGHEMSLLFKHLRIHQIFGANTNVGKTIISTALARRADRVIYLKPVSSGPPEDADDGHVLKYTNLGNRRVQAECLYRLRDPVSPHLAAIREDATYNRQAQEVGKQTHMYVETAGVPRRLEFTELSGVHSPGISGTTQLDLYRRLFLPAILVGDSKLGGISATISAYESLLLRGYDIDAVLLFKDSYYRNYEYLESYFKTRSIRTFAVDTPPEKHSNPTLNSSLTEEYYERITSQSSENDITAAVTHLDTCHQSRLATLDSLPRRTLDAIWWPFVQHKHLKSESDVSVIDSALSDFFSVFRRRTPTKTATSLLQSDFDGSASWWTQALGHGHPPLLSRRRELVAVTDTHGSCTQMALRSVSKHTGISREDSKRLGVLGLKGSYHGDTIGAMDACEEGVYTCDWHNAKGYWFDPPTVGIKDGRVSITLPNGIDDTALDDLVSDSNHPPPFTMSNREWGLSWLKSTPKYHTDPPEAESPGRHFRRLGIRTFGHGSWRHDLRGSPLPENHDRHHTERRYLFLWLAGLPVIFDEVFVGLYRIGMESTGPLLGVLPDISVHAKILTGGNMPLAATLASDSIFQTFLGDSKADALLHGHSYTAHPIGCAVANETLKIIQELSTSEHWITAKENWSQASGSSRIWSLWDRNFVMELSRMGVVKEVMAMGTVLVIKLKGEEGYVSTSAQAFLSSLKVPELQDSSSISPSPSGVPFGVHFRTLGDVAYFMTSLNTSSDVIRSLEDRIWSALQKQAVQDE
ncbi:onanonoxo-7-onima-8-eninoihtemlysoneda [Salix suchowensis]|nr:onanonoxo-7-onima-8-eninoihtemlysoneda [Salix suchowensis]